MEPAQEVDRDLYSDLVENTSDLVQSITPDGRILYTNPAWRQTLGYSEKDIKTLSIFEAIHPESKEHCMGVFKRLFSGEKIGRFEAQFKTKGGKKIWVEGSSSCKFVNGKAVSSRGIFRDVTERKQAEVDTRNKYEFLQLIQDVAITAYRAKTSVEAFRMAVDKICSYTKWPVGHVYFAGDQAAGAAGVLTPSNIWHFDDAEKFRVFHEVTMKVTFAPGIGLPGRVWQNKKPAWIPDVTRDPNFPRAKIANNIAVKGAFGFPVILGDRVIAVLEFFSDKIQEPDAEFLKVVSIVGIQLGRVIERMEAESVLFKKVADLEQLNKLMVGRELKMLELKKEIEELKKKPEKQDE